MLYAFLFYVKVCRHMAKLFDNMSTLEFAKDDEGAPTKEAIGMYSKENEYVKFKEPFMCTGQVGVLLCVLSSHNPNHEQELMGASA